MSLAGSRADTSPGSIRPAPLFERFFLGGPNSLRGWKFRDITPLDQTTSRRAATVEILANVEYLIPLPFNLRLALFVDVGNVYGFSTPFDITKLKADVGAGLRWLSPFGPHPRGLRNQGSQGFAHQPG